MLYDLKQIQHLWEFSVAWLHNITFLIEILKLIVGDTSLLLALSSLIHHRL